MRIVDDHEVPLRNHQLITLASRELERANDDGRLLERPPGGPVGAIAVTYIEFASAHEVKTVLEWTVVRDAASASAFVDRLTRRPAPTTA